MRILPSLALGALALGAVPARPDEKPKADDQAAKPEKPRVELSGYGQFDYRRAGADDAGTAARHEVVGRRVRLSVSGSIDDRLSYAFTVQGDGLNANSASLLDASATLRLATWARLQAGQYKYDFDLAGRESASLLTLSDRPFATQTIAGGLNGASTPASPSGSYRDRGVTLSGDRLDGKVAYSIGAFQGNGRASDNNSSFAWVARAQGSPARGLRLSVGFLDSASRDEGEADPGHYRAWTFGATFEYRALFLRGEYYAARRTRSDGRQDSEGFYLEATRRIREAFEVLARYQRLDGPTVTTAGAIQSVDLGARYYLARRGSRGGSSILANILLRDAPHGALEGLTHLNDGRGAPVTTGSDLDPVFVLRLQVQF